MAEKISKKQCIDNVINYIAEELNISKSKASDLFYLSIRADYVRSTIFEQAYFLHTGKDWDDDE